MYQEPEPDIVITNPDLEKDIYNNEYQVTININNTLPALANSLRRIMLSEIPNVGFDHTSYEDSAKNSIQVIENTSALHNEFISHRVSLVPLCSYISGRLNIKSSFNLKTAKRIEEWCGQDTPTFEINVTNTEQIRENYQAHRPTDLETENDMLVVTTADFTIKSRDDIKDPDKDNLDAFIRPDIVSLKLDPNNHYKHYIILDKLKNSEKLHLIAKPTIGKGEKHTSYSPVGTVSYKFKEDIEKQPLIFEHYLASLSEERVKKGLDIFDKDEEDEILISYKLLDAKRVYLRDRKGNANSIEMKVESIGGMLPIDIVNYSIDVLIWKLKDILSCCIATYHQLENKLYYRLLGKIKINESTSKMTAYDIRISDENHTIGNVVTKYLQDLYLGEILEFISYKKPHPLENDVVFRIKLKDGFDNKKFIKLLFNLRTAPDTRNTFNGTLGEILDNLEEALLDTLHEEKLNEFVILFMFLQGCNMVLRNLYILKNKWSARIESIKVNQKNPNFLIFGSDSKESEWFNNIEYERQDEDLLYNILLANKSLLFKEE